jgi:hypothetical protein
MKVGWKIFCIVLLLAASAALCCAQGLGDGFPPNPFNNGNGNGHGLVNNPNYPGVPEPSAVITCVITIALIALHRYRRNKT